MSPETQPDLSDKEWDDLVDAEYELLRELASATEYVRGDGSRESIAAGLLASDDRADEVPEEYRASIPDEIREDGEDGEDDEDGEDGEDEAKFQKASNYQPEADDAFIIEADPLQKWVEHVNTLVDEAKIHITFDNLWVKAVDAANVAMVQAKIQDTAFDSFDVPDDGVIGVNYVRFKSVVNKAESGQLVHIRYDATTRNLIVRFGGHEFSIALIDPASIRQEPDLPDLDLPSTVEVDGRTLRNAVTFADEVTDHIEFGVTPQSAGDPAAFEVYAEGDTDDYSGTFTDDDGVELIDLPTNEVRSLYSLDYLKSATKPFSASQMLRIELGQEFPVKIHGDIEVDDKAVGDVTYMIAPRIQAR